MNFEDVNKLGTQLAAEAAAPLMNEAAARLGIDLEADDRLGFRVLGDLALCMFAAGFNHGATETTAQFLERLPPSIGVQIVPPPRADPAPLGDHPDWKEPT